MKIAIIAPSPIPFTIGGAEKLWLGIFDFINKHTTHQCELIKIPTKEDNFWNLLNAYETFHHLDLSHFDMIITGKYPAWMVQHDNHHIYMLHCLRGFYDCYHFMKLPNKLKTKNPKMMNILQKLEKKETTSEEIFYLVNNLKNDNTIDQNIFNFPGVFIKQLVHFFDQKAMQNIKHFSAISQTVAYRKEYFPENTKVKVIHPPSVLTNFHNKSSKYFFTVSRLDDAKRIQMIIEAYMLSSTNIPLKIAGTGPLMAKFIALIKHDSRIELLGFVSDQDLVAYYANAYAVLFVPYDEDYGLITIEAMMCQKPVLTFDDAGGVLEFVEDQVTGLICKPNSKALSKNITYLSEHPKLCKEMGENAKQKIKNITWENTINNLLDTANKTLNTIKDMKQITVVTTYPIYPPRGGGQNRIFYLYKEVAKSMKVEIICLAHENDTYQKTEIAPNLFEIRVPKTKSHAKKEWKMHKNAGIPITDIAMLYLYNETTLLKTTIKESFKYSDYLIATQPYTYDLCKSISNKVIHDSQNVEYNLKKQMLNDTPNNRELLNKLFQTEKKACQEALATTVCAYNDAEMFETLYQYDKSKATIVPNGVDLESVPYISTEARFSLKQNLGLEYQKIILFIGSWHQPNIDATEEIFKMAIQLPDYSFIIMGSVGNYFEDRIVPRNVAFTGITDDDEKEMYLSIADIAINPMLTGSGTNLKMLDYMANGIPVLSTNIGARGLNIPKEYIAICTIDEFSKYIIDIENYTDIEKSRLYVEENFSWTVIKDNLNAIL